ncbi:MAG: hypothetical protein ACK5NN_12280 [Sphingomonadaceae bacterium]
MDIAGPATISAAVAVLATFGGFCVWLDRLGNSALHCGAGRLLSAFDQVIQRATDNAWIIALGIANLPRLVDGFARQANVSSRWGKVVIIWNDFRPSSLLTNLPALLRRIIFIRQPALGYNL